MDVELMNQYRMIIDLEEHGKHEYIYRTKMDLDDFKKSGEFEVLKDTAERAEWIIDMPVYCVKARAINNENGSINTVRSFFVKNSDIGYKGYSTLDELKKYDLVYVKGYGEVDNIYKFEKAFKEAATKK